MRSIEHLSTNTLQDVIYRNPGKRPTHGSAQNAQWRSRPRLCWVVYYFVLLDGVLMVKSVTSCRSCSARYHGGWVSNEVNTFAIEGGAGRHDLDATVNLFPEYGHLDA